jgi:hypothetical protein
VTLAVIENSILAFTEFTFLKNAIIQLFQVVLGETIVLQELLDFIVNVFGETRSLITILNLEFVDQKPLELLSLLDVEEALTAGLTHP